MPNFSELPTLQRMLVDLIVFFVIDEVGLYYIHRQNISQIQYLEILQLHVQSPFRLQHHPKLYAAVHKKHHEWNAPIAIVFTYSTQMEYVMTLIPVNIVSRSRALINVNVSTTSDSLITLVLFREKKGPLIMNPHITTLWTWYTLVHLRGIKNHSGYHFPWFMWPSAHAHDFHHMTSNSCFGKSLVLDRLHGTDKGFRVYMARKKEKEEQDRKIKMSNKSK